MDFRLSTLLAQLLERLPEFHRAGYVVEGLGGTAGADDGYRTVVKDAAHNRLIDVYCFDFREVHLKGSPCDEALLNYDAPGGDNEF